MQSHCRESVNRKEQSSTAVMDFRLLGRSHVHGIRGAIVGSEEYEVGTRSQTGEPTCYELAITDSLPSLHVRMSPLH